VGGEEVGRALWRRTIRGMRPQYVDRVEGNLLLLVTPGKGRKGELVRERGQTERDYHAMGRTAWGRLRQVAIKYVHTLTRRKLWTTRGGRKRGHIVHRNADTSRDSSLKPEGGDREEMKKRLGNYWRERGRVYRE